MVMFALVTSITPGPNNMMLLASGVNFGLRATLPHLLGVTVGLTLLLIPSGLGLQGVFAGHPRIHSAMKWVGTAYLLYLAWKISRSAEPAQPGTKAQAVAGRPIGFVGAALFQIVNPKVWVMILGYFSTCVPARADAALVIAASLLFGAVNFPCVGAWALMGEKLRRFLQDRQRRRIFSYSMAGLLVLSVGMSL
jgi:threonine/homoserine/homoserine lactone efflux protein